MTDTHFRTLQRQYENKDPVPRADMHGWDTVYAVRFEAINRELIRQFGEGGIMAAALRIDYEDEDVAIHGAFEPWQLATGGSGNEVAIAVRFASGEATLKESGKVVSLTGASVKLRAKIGLHRVSGVDDTADGTVATCLKVVASGKVVTAGDAASLRAAFSQIDAKASDDDRSDANVQCDDIAGLDLSDCTPHEAKHFDAFLKPGIVEWFGTNESIFDFAFLTVDIAEQEDTGDFAWIKPTQVAYAVTDVIGANGKPSANQSIFAILAMTEGRKAEGRANFEVSASAIPINPGVDAAFLISNERFMEKHILPQCHKVFEGIADVGSDASGAAKFCMENGRLANSAAILMPLDLHSEKLYAQFPGDVHGRIEPGNFKVVVGDTTIQFDFEAITFPYGANDLVNVELMMRYEQAIGIDEDCHFAVESTGTQIHHVSVYPDPEKAAWEAAKSFGVTILVSLGLYLLGPLVGRVGSRLFSGAKSLLGKAAGTVAQSGKGLIAREAAQIGETEIMSISEEAVSQATKSGGAAVLGAEAAATGEVISLKTISTGEKALAGDVVETVTPKAVSPAAVPERAISGFTAMMVGQFAGQVFGLRSNLAIMAAYKQTPESLPSIADFGQHCLTSITWPGNSRDVHKLSFAGLNGAFVLGFEITR